MRTFLVRYANPLLLVVILASEGATVPILTRLTSTPAPPPQSIRPREARQKPIAECAVGDFSVYNCADRRRLTRIDFKVVAMVAPSELEALDEELKQKRQRLTDAISSLVRFAPMAQIVDGDLLDLKEAILHTVTETVGRDEIHIDAILIPELKIRPL